MQNPCRTDPYWRKLLERPLTLLSHTLEKPTDRLNGPVQGTGADGLKLALTPLWERRNQCPGAMPVLVCHDEIVDESTADQAADAEAWVEKTMIKGMAVIMNGMDEVGVPVEVEARIAGSWRKRRLARWSLARSSGDR